MKVAIDTRPLKFAQTGLKTYLAELVNQWNQSNSMEIVLLAPTTAVYNGSNKLKKIREHIKFIWWKQYQLPKAAAKNNCTHIFCADFFVPYCKRWNGITLKTIAVLHDAFFWESPEHYNTIWLQLFHLMGVPAARKANLLIVPTQFAKQRIIHFENFDPLKMCVVHEAAKTLPLLSQPESYIANLAPELLGANYFLHVGVLEKRKNITTLLEAFSMVHSTHPNYKLVLVGNTPVKDNLNDAPAINETIYRLQISDAIVRLGYLDAENLASIYQCAFCYVFPSLNEGFGLPVLEAFNAGLPTICANNSALPEVAGDAALFFDPYDAAQLANRMQQVIADPLLKQNLSLKGKQRLTQFSWAKAAMETQHALEQL